VASGLNTEVNEFAKTGVGKLVIFVILWKVVGANAVGFFVGLLMLTVLGFTFTKLHLRKSVKNKETGALTYVSRYDWHQDRDDSYPGRIFSSVVHVLLFVLAILIMVV